MEDVGVMSGKTASRNKMEDAVDLGTWMGRKQAFSLIAGRCSAADAECIRRMRGDRTYRTLGLNWEKFCRERLGISRSNADSIVRQLEEFGPAFFTLAQVMHITADEYRRISSAISGEKLLHAGEEIPIETGNAPRLAAAIEDLRRQREAEAAPPVDAEPTGADIDAVFAKIESAVEALSQDIEQACALPLDAARRANLRTQLLRAVNRLGELGLAIEL
jgi:hypothetical protein